MIDNSDLLDALEPSQRAAATSLPLPRKKLGRGTHMMLMLMRVYVFMAIPLVIYAFFHALQTG